MIEALGAINKFVSSASFQVAGQSVDASGSGVKFEDGAATDLADGRIVKVGRSPSGMTRIANRMEFKD